MVRARVVPQHPGGPVRHGPAAFLEAARFSLAFFWLHFVALNLFLGSWVSSDGIKYNMSRGLIFIPLVLIYFTGPLGFVLYWLIRVFYAKRLTLHD